jgi:hypothetical protein
MYVCMCVCMYHVCACSNTCHCKICMRSCNLQGVTVDVVELYLHSNIIHLHFTTLKNITDLMEFNVNLNYVLIHN